MKKISINKTDPDMTQMIELVDKALKHSRKQRNIGQRKVQIQFLEINI